MLNLGFWFGDVVFNSNEYIKVIGITAVLLLFGLINSVSAIVFPESSDDSAVEKISIYPGSSNEHDIQSAFIFGSGNNTNDNVTFSSRMADQGQAYLISPINLAPTSALYLGYDLGLQGVKNKKDYLYSFANPADTGFMANTKWHNVNLGTDPGIQVGHSVMINYPTEWAISSRDDLMTFSQFNAAMDNQAVVDSTDGSRIAEWSSSISVSRNISGPATLVFLGLGLVGIGVVRWRKVFAKKYVFRSMPQREVYALVSSSATRNF